MVRSKHRSLKELSRIRLRCGCVHAGNDAAPSGCGGRIDEPTSTQPMSGTGGTLRSMEHTQRIDLSIEPLDEYVVVQPTSDETETRAGLILPASAVAATACRTGIVTAVGADANGIEPGDKVLYPREAGFDVRLGGLEVKVLKRAELIGRIHD